jgi:hypothetical protein
MVIKCGFCGKEKSVVRMSTKDIVPDYGWVCPDCLTNDPMDLEAIKHNDLNNNDKKEDI